MYLIVGLGNPGKEYENTRHNLGFLVADKLAESSGTVFRPGKGNYWLTKCSLNNAEVTILKPVTYMNNSGIGVQEFLERYKVTLENILVVCDDFQLPIGTIRLRQNGTDGGHNGLASIIYHLQSDQFARLRCGIASEKMPEEKLLMKNFVLETFPDTEIPIVDQMVLRAQDACISFVTDGIDQVMNRFNANPFKEEFF